MGDGTIFNGPWNNNVNILLDALKVKVTLITICQCHTVQLVVDLWLTLLY